ncbi:GIY-YIG nuclease family protein [Rhodococcus hoagii]|nr:GIY-YIG nuclease family protein [Prescottella equi]NKS75527.1 GIY-YIG nuclease family protein [Prescottella equi]
MFGTVLYDEFTSEDSEKVADALEELCSPLDNYGWASVGVYMFSKPATDSMLESWADHVLYVGLARDLPLRFRQHAGLLSCPASGCKRKNIAKWFGDNEKIRFSCFVQSPLNQSIGHRRRDELNKHFDEENDDYFEEDPPYGLEAASRLEGQLIETYRLEQGKRPPWNRRGGSKEGAAIAAGGSGNALLAYMSGAAPSTLVLARRTIRELAADANAVDHETFLHAMRTEAIIHSPTGASNEAIAERITIASGNQILQPSVDRLLSAGYISDLVYSTSAESHADERDSSELD